MAWNEPGRDKDPWKGNGGEQRPPDLDEIVKNLQRQLGSLFGGRGRRGELPGGGSIGLGLLLAIGAIIWLLTGVYKVDAGERGVVLRFGAYTVTTPPGLHWHLPWPIERVLKVNIDEREEFNYRNQMLTTDENIVTISMTVQYRRNEPRAYLFNVRDPSVTLQLVSESAIREIVGENTAEWVLGEGRNQIVDRTQELMQATLTDYGAGIEVTSVNLVEAQPPAQVQAAVDDATKAREDKERFVLQAESFENDLLPRARGEAVRQIQAAEAYRERVINNALGDTSRFLQLLAEYEKAPQVTRERLYLEAIERVYASATKVLLDTDESGNLIYLPVDQLIQQQRRAPLRDNGASSATGPAVSGNESDSPDRDELRSRSRESR